MHINVDKSNKKLNCCQMTADEFHGLDFSQYLGSLLLDTRTFAIKACSEL